MYDHSSLGPPHYCLKMQTPFLEALRPLEGQIKLSFVAVKIPRPQNHSIERTKARIIYSKISSR